MVRPISVLVIDDDPLARSTVRTILESEGYSVTCAVDGQTGLAAFRKSRPDLVVTDILMPEKEGLESIIELRAEWPEGRIIAISGGGRINNIDYLKMAKELGADATLEKPCEPQDLIEMVNRCLGPRLVGRALTLDAHSQ
jgi:CheY-like chemotaxis protein